MPLAAYSVQARSVEQGQGGCNTEGGAWGSTKPKIKDARICQEVRRPRKTLKIIKPEQPCHLE